MLFRNRNTQSRVLPRPPERREMSSHMHMMESSLKNTSYPSESDLKACFDPSLAILPHSGSQAAKRDKHSPLRQHPTAVRSNMPVLKPKRVKPVNQQSFTNSPPKHQGVSLKVSVKNIIFPCESEVNSSVGSSHSGSQAVMADKLAPFHQHPIAVRSNLPVLKPTHIPVKPVNKQNFTDGYPEHHGLSSKVSVKNVIFPCDSERNANVYHSSSLLEPSHVPVVPVDGQRFTYGPPKHQGVSSPKHKTEFSVKNISFPSCEPGMNTSVELSLPVLPFLKPSCALVKLSAGQKFNDGHPVSRFPAHLLKEAEKNVSNPSCGSDLESHLSLPRLPSFTKGPVRTGKSTPIRQHAVAAPVHLPNLKPNCAPVKPVDGQNEPTGRFFLTETDEKISVSCERSTEHGGVKSPKNLIEVSGRNVTGSSCKSDLNASVDRSLPVLPYFGRRAVRVNKCQNPVAVPTHFPALKPSRPPVKLSAGTPGGQVSRFSTFVMNEVDRNGSDPDLKDKTLSLPRLPSFTSGPVKVDKRALKPNVPVQSAGDTQKRVVTKNVILSQIDDEGVKMKRPQPDKSNPLQLSRFCFEFTEHPHENKPETCL